MWEIRYNGSANGEDVAYDITLDNEDNVIITGMSTEQGGEYCTTMKYSNPLGIQEDDISGLTTLTPSYPYYMSTSSLFFDES